ncbi:MAG: hypothetical protein COA32_10530 [Fluviicola sp.]|nr:MAG: hypothetical protein COA32_10530 [Fluviicola sp.]
MIQLHQEPNEKRSHNSKSSSATVAFTDNRSENTRQLKVQEMANQSIQRQENKTGMPDQLKSGIENLSGIDMSDVKVHYNSSQPAQLQAHAFAQGNQIHIASGQERHLPHEAWHVVQQKQGRVQPNRQLKGKVKINDDEGLEREADVMGAKALQSSSPTAKTIDSTKTLNQKDTTPINVQRVLKQGDLHGSPQQVIENYLRKNKKYELLLLPQHKSILSDLIQEVTNEGGHTEYYIPGSVESTNGLISIDSKLNEAFLKAIPNPSQTTGLKLYNNSHVNNPWILYKKDTNTIELNDHGRSNDSFVTVAQTCSVMSIVWLNSGKTKFTDLDKGAQIKFANILINYKSLADQLQWVLDKVNGAGSYVIYTDNHFYAAKKVDNNYDVYDSNTGAIQNYNEVGFNAFVTQSGYTIYPPLNIKSDLAQTSNGQKNELTGLLDVQKRHSELRDESNSEKKEQLKGALDKSNEAQMHHLFKDDIVENADKKKEYDVHRKLYSLKLTAGLDLAEGVFEKLSVKERHAKYKDFKLTIQPPLDKFAEAYHHINYFIQQKLANQAKYEKAYHNRSYFDVRPYDTEDESKYKEFIIQAEQQMAHWESQIEGILNELKEKAERFVHSILKEEQVTEKIEAGIKIIDLDPVKNLQLFVDKQKWLTSTLNKMLEEGVEKLMDAKDSKDKKQILLDMMKFKNVIQRYIQGSLDTYIQMKQNNAAEVIKNQNSLAAVELIHKSFSLAAGALAGGLGIWEHFAKQDSPSPGIGLHTTSIPSAALTHTSANPNTWRASTSGQLGVTANLTGGLGSAQVAVDVVEVYTVSSTLVNLIFGVIKAYYGKKEPVPAEQAKYTLLLEQASMHMSQEMSLVESTYRNALETVKTFAAIK